MFKSKRRAIITPQFEHLRLVGALALHWGNPDFDHPPIAPAAMILGMGQHDRGYGLLDNHPIGGMAADEWNGIARRGFYMHYADTTADTIAKYHIRRLASHDDSAERQAMTAEFSQAIDEQLRQHGLSHAAFDRIDRITNLCDKISFDFCLDVPAEGSVAVYPRNREDTEITVHYRIADGLIQVQPWPFSLPEFQGYITAYQAHAYPETLEPVILPYRIASLG